MTHDRKVMSSIVGSCAHRVIAEGHIHPPVQTYRPIQACGIGRQVADVKTMLKRGLALDRAFRGNHGKRWRTPKRQKAADIKTL